MIYSILPIEYEKVPDKSNLVGIIGNQVKFLNGPAAVKQEYPSKIKPKISPILLESGICGIKLCHCTVLRMGRQEGYVDC